MLDDETLVTRSTQLDEVPRARLSALAVMSGVADAPPPVVPDDVLTTDPVAIQALPASARDWATMRMSRASATADRFHGRIGPQTPKAWSVSALETYLGCPFRFFAQHVLRLEAFFAAWQASGRRAITPDNIDEARVLFAEAVDRSLTDLPEEEAGLERTRLLGSSAAAGLGEAVLRMEAERPTAVVERLLEHRLDGDVEIATESGTRVVHLRGKADRLDLLEDGTFRLIDYKLGWPPNKARALQLPIYGLCAEQRLARRHGRAWTLGEAAYLAFKGPKRVVPLFSGPGERDEVLAKAQQRLADTLDAIDRGEFPPAPDDVFRCETCDFASVCRKDYVG
jgi:RecB family exonuclease